MAADDDEYIGLNVGTTVDVSSLLCRLRPAYSVPLDDENWIGASVEVDDSLIGKMSQLVAVFPLVTPFDDNE